MEENELKSNKTLSKKLLTKCFVTFFVNIKQFKIIARRPKKKTKNINKKTFYVKKKHYICTS